MCINEPSFHHLDPRICKVFLINNFIIAHKHFFSLPINSSGDAINSDSFLLEAAVIVLESPHDCSIWIFFAILSQDLSNWLLWLVVWVVWLLMWSLLIKVLSSRSLGLRLGKIALLLNWSWAFNVEALCVWFWLLEGFWFRGEDSSSWRCVFVFRFFVDRLSFVDKTSFCDCWLRSVWFPHTNRWPWSSLQSSALLVVSKHW